MYKLWYISLSRCSVSDEIQHQGLLVVYSGLASNMTFSNKNPLVLSSYSGLQNHDRLLVSVSSCGPL